MEDSWGEAMHYHHNLDSGIVGFETEDATKYSFETFADSFGIGANSPPKHGTGVIPKTRPMNVPPRVRQTPAGMNASAAHEKDDVTAPPLSAGLPQFGTMDPAKLAHYLGGLESGSGGAISNMAIYRAPSPLDVPELSAASTSASTSSEPNSDVSEGIALNVTLDMGFDTWQPFGGTGGSGAEMEMSEPAITWDEFAVDFDKPYTIDLSMFSWDPLREEFILKDRQLPAPGGRPGGSPRNQSLSQSDATAKQDGLPKTVTAPSHVKTDSIRSHGMAISYNANSVPAHVAPNYIEDTLKTSNAHASMDNDCATIISAAESEYGSRCSPAPTTAARTECPENIHIPTVCLTDKAYQTSCEQSEPKSHTDCNDTLWDPNESGGFRASSEVSSKTSPPWPPSPRYNSSLPSSTTDLESPLSGDDDGSDTMATENNIPGYLVPIIVRDILQTFFCVHSTVGYDPVDQDEQKQSAPQRQSQAQTSNSGNMPPPQNQEASNSRKRKQIDDANEQPGDGDGDDEDKDHPRKKVALLKGPTSNILWACPFLKWKPLKYHSCYKYVMTDISRVKQHLKRYHEMPFCCPTCWAEFRELEDFYNHVHERKCTEKPKNEVDGITPYQRKLLEQRSDSRQSKHEQWYAMYSVIFPEAPRPVNPYVESNISAELLSFQRFMSREGPEIIERTARTHIPGSLQTQRDIVLSFAQTLFQHAIPAVLQRYERTRPNNNTPDSGYASLGSAKLDKAAKPQHETSLVDDIVQSITVARATDIKPQQPALSPERSSNQLLNDVSALADMHESQPEVSIDTNLPQDLAVVPDPSFVEGLTWDPTVPFSTDTSGMANFDLSMVEWNDIFPTGIGNDCIADLDGNVESGNDVPYI